MEISTVLIPSPYEKSIMNKPVLILISEDSGWTEGPMASLALIEDLQCAGKLVQQKPGASLA